MMNNVCRVSAADELALDNNSAMIQLMAGAGVAVVGTVLIPLLNGLFTT